MTRHAHKFTRANDFRSLAALSRGAELLRFVKRRRLRNQRSVAASIAIPRREPRSCPSPVHAIEVIGATTLADQRDLHDEIDKRRGCNE
jgi:hypothetical protein